MHCTGILCKYDGWGVVRLFVFSLKTSKKPIVSILVCVLMLIAILVAVVVWPASETSAKVYSPAAGATDVERVEFLKSLGYEVDATGAEVREVLIPDEFDEVFTKYNEIQQTAGMDLSPYQGRRMKCWTYQVLNYPDDGSVLAHLYVYKDKIVGGDVSSTALDGFMRGLTALSSNSSS